jgi:hypothetical protein
MGAFSNWVVQSAYKPARGSWQAPVNVSEVQEKIFPPPEHEAFAPQVAFDRHGDAIAVWSSEEVGGNNPSHEYPIDVVQSAYRPVRGSWQTPVDLSEPGGEATEPQVALDADGNAVAIWEAKDNRARCFGEHMVRASSRPAGGAWQTPVDLSGTGGECRAEGPRLAVDSRGDAVAVWIRSELVAGRGARWVQAASRPAGGSWQAPIDLSQVGGSAGAAEPEVAIDPQGDAVAIWEQGFENGEFMQASIRPAGGAWQAPEDVSEPGQTTEPDVALDASGNAIAVWHRYQGHVIQSAVRPAGGAWQTPVNVTEVNEGTSQPRVASDRSGNAVAVWLHASHNGDIGTKIVQSAAYERHCRRDCRSEDERSARERLVAPMQSLARARPCLRFRVKAGVLRNCRFSRSKELSDQP